MGLNEFFPDDIDMDHTYASQVSIVPPDEANELRNYEDDGRLLPDFDIPESWRRQLWIIYLAELPESQEVIQISIILC